MCIRVIHKLVEVEQRQPSEHSLPRMPCAFQDPSPGKKKKPQMISAQQVCVTAEGLKQSVEANSTSRCMKGTLWPTAWQLHSAPVKRTDQALARFTVMTNSPFDFLWRFTPTPFKSNYHSFYARGVTLRPGGFVYICAAIFPLCPNKGDSPATDYCILQANQSMVIDDGQDGVWLYSQIRVFTTYNLQLFSDARYQLICVTHPDVVDT